MTDTAAERFAMCGTQEQTVAARLETLGWSVAPFGQDRFGDEIVLALKARRPPALLRWLPDFIAARGGKVALVESKSGTTWAQTGRHDVEISALAAYSAIESVFGVPVIIVWPDFTCTFAQDVQPIKWHLEPAAWTRGSKTPFALVQVGDGRPFDTVFGGQL